MLFVNFRCLLKQVRGRNMRAKNLILKCAKIQKEFRPVFCCRCNIRCSLEKNMKNVLRFVRFRFWKLFFLLRRIYCCWWVLKFLRRAILKILLKFRNLFLFLPVEAEFLLKKFVLFWFLRLDFFSVFFFVLIFDFFSAL